MSEHHCSNCGKFYEGDEYFQLPSREITDGAGKETVCKRCGKGMHTEKWQKRETIDTPDGEIDISTVALIIPHGVDREQLYESCAFHKHGSNVVRRYKTEAEAYIGHTILLEALRRGDYTFSQYNTIYIAEPPP